MASRSMLASVDTTRNFWEVNKGFLLIKEFRELRDKDKSPNGETSSKLMWGVMLFTKPTLDLSNLSVEERLKLINSDFLQKLKLDPEKTHKDIIGLFEIHAMSRLERIAKDWGDKLDERFKLLKEIKYELSNAEELDKMMSRTDKLWAQYITCLNDLDTEQAQSQVEGGAVESLNESGAI